MPEPENINIFATVFRNLYDFKSYRIYLKNTLGRGFLYILILTLLFGGFTAVDMVRSMNEAFADVQISFENDFPDFRFTENGLQVDGKMPIIKESKDFFYAIDIEGNLDRSILQKYSKGILITNDMIYYKKNMFETREYELQSLKQFAPITKNTLKKILSYLWVISIFIIIFYSIYFYIGKIFSAFVIAFLGLMLKGIVKSKAEFGDIFKLSIYALTLPVLIKAVNGFFSIEIPLFFLIYYGVGIVYLLLALKEVKAE